MTRRGSSFGFFGMFGRSSDLRQLDAALRAVDLHPVLVPEGVKLTVVNLMKDHSGDEEPPPQAYPFVAGLVGYCLLGADAFERVNGAGPRQAVERRIENAIETEGSLDSQLLLLALHSRLIQPDVVARFGLAVEDGS